MKDPCIICISRPCCNTLCTPEREYRHYIDHNINCARRFIYSKNNHPRKKIPDDKRLLYNSFIEKWNRHAKIATKIIYRREIHETSNNDGDDSNKVMGR